MTTLQDGQFNIGSKCASPGCDRTILFDSIFCTSHQLPDSPSPLSNHRKQLGGPDSKFVARKSMGILHPWSTTHSSASSHSSKSPEIPLRKKPEHRLQNLARQPTSNGVARQPLLKEGSAQAVIKDILETNRRSRSQDDVVENHNVLHTSSNKSFKENTNVHEDKPPNSVQNSPLGDSGIKTFRFKAGISPSQRSTEDQSQEKSSYSYTFDTSLVGEGSLKGKNGTQESRDSIEQHEIDEFLSSALCTGIFSKSGSYKAFPESSSRGRSVSDNHNTFFHARVGSAQKASTLGKRKADEMNHDELEDVQKTTTRSTSLQSTSRPQDDGENKTVVLSKPSTMPKQPSEGDGPLNDGFDGTQYARDCRNDHGETPLTVNSKNHVPEKLVKFNSNDFDAVIYRQSDLKPPTGVPTPSRLPMKAKALSEDELVAVAVDPAIHRMHKRSEEWYRKKLKEIQERGGRKAWFGEPGKRIRWLRSHEAAQEEELSNDYKRRVPIGRRDPTPWGYRRVVDFSDVAKEDLPEDVQNNPAWAKACAWMRESMQRTTRRQRELERTKEETERFFMDLINRNAIRYGS